MMLRGCLQVTNYHRPSNVRVDSCFDYKSDIVVVNETAGKAKSSFGSLGRSHHSRLSSCRVLAPLRIMQLGVDLKVFVFSRCFHVKPLS